MLSLGIDIGTSGIRAAAVDTNGAVVAFARADHLPQKSTQIDATLWWDATAQCLEALGRDLQDGGHSPREIEHICVDGTSGSMVLTDAHLVPVTRALMYNSKGFDLEADLIASVAPSPHIARGPGSGLARALHLIREDVDHRACHLLHQADFIVAKLTGTGGHSDVMNSLKTGVDPITGQWPKWISALLPENLLPKAHGLGDVIKEISSDVAARFGFAVTATVHAGTTDSIAAYLAAAPLEKGVAVTSLGTTLAIKVPTETRIDVPQLGLYSHRVGDIWLVGGASNTGGGVLRHYFSDRELVDLSEQIDPDLDPGLDYYPLLTPGERFPINDPTLEPRLTPEPANRVAFLHGILDGIARIEAKCYQTVRENGGAYPHRIISVGGGALNTAFTAVRARHLGLQPEVAKYSEAAIGVALRHTIG